jgi:hypothetical protein
LGVHLQQIAGTARPRSNPRTSCVGVGNRRETPRRDRQRDTVARLALGSADRDQPRRPARLGVFLADAKRTRQPPEPRPDNQRAGRSMPSELALLGRSLLIQPRTVPRRDAYLRHLVRADPLGWVALEQSHVVTRNDPIEIIADELT